MRVPAACAPPAPSAPTIAAAPKPANGDPTAAIAPASTGAARPPVSYIATPICALVSPVRCIQHVGN